jgi:hypothetical protein
MSDLEKYCNENEPTEIIRDKVGRWVQRIWIKGGVKIVESYSYEYSDDFLLNNRDIKKFRASYNVLNVNREEVTNG